jgi:hypothetical protein
MIASSTGWTPVPGGATYATLDDEVFHASPKDVMVEAAHIFCEKMRGPDAQPCCKCVTMLGVYQQKGL